MSEDKKAGKFTCLISLKIFIFCDSALDEYLTLYHSSFLYN